MALTLDQEALEYISSPSSIIHGDTYANRNWCVIQTKSRQEKKLARHLFSRGLDYFLPLQRHKIGKNFTYRPLFDGIVFLADIKGKQVNSSPNEFTLIERHQHCFHTALEIARSSNAVYSVLHTLNQPQLKRELIALSSESPECRTLQIERFQTGDRVKVIAGSMVNFKGTVESWQEKETRITIKLEMLGQLVSMKISTDLIELI